MIDHKNMLHDWLSKIMFHICTKYEIQLKSWLLYFVIECMLLHLCTLVVAAGRWLNAYYIKMETSYETQSEQEARPLNSNRSNSICSKSRFRIYYGKVRTQHQQK